MDALQSELAKIGSSRAVVFSGKTLASDPSGLSRVKETLGTRYAGSFTGIKPHSPLPAILEAVSFLKDSGADAVIALGGGSPIVTARAATIILYEGKNIVDLHTRFEKGQTPISPKLDAAKIPQFAVVTTPTTACVKIGTAVLDPSQGRRLTMADPKTRTRAIIIDDDLAMSAPTPLVLDSALNTFSMAVQGLEAANSDAIAEGELLQALRLLHRNIPLVGTTDDSGTVRRNLIVASALAGRGTDHALIGISSALGHCFAARHHVSNGASNAVLLPHTIRFNAPETGDRLQRLGEVFGVPNASASDVADLCADFFRLVGVPARLRDIGVRLEDCESVIEDVSFDWFYYQNPRRIKNDREIREILADAL